MVFPDCNDKCVLVLGVGSYLMGDEGVGVHVAQRLSEQKLPYGVEVLDGGTGGFHLMGIFEQYEVVVLVDATIDGQPASTIRLLEPRFASDFPRSMSTHDVGLRDVLEALQLTGRMPKVYVVAISVEELQPMTIRLSPAVQEAALKVQAEVSSLLWDWWRERHISAGAVDQETEISFT
ncbi:MAG: hydrogenase maturation protease [Saprospirales bacterium]|nr:hydrogenase maturation protease [Saprospirales bacterium]